jgi:hypothetical protein
MNRRSLLTTFTFQFLAPSFARAATPSKATLQLIKDSNCGCCGDHA